MKRRLTPTKEDVDVVHRPHKKLDLRNYSYSARYTCKKFEFGFRHEKENITTHSTDSVSSIRHKHEEVKQLLMEALHTLHEKNTPSTPSFIFIYIVLEWRVILCSVVQVLIDVP